MRSVRLVAAEDEYDCEPGLIIKGLKHFEGMMADRDGSLIAHDLLEHQNGLHNIGTVWDELEALGAIWQVRGRHGDLLTDGARRSIHSPEVHVAADITRMADEGLWLSIPRTKRCDYDEDFYAICQIAKKDIIAEYDFRHVDIDHYLAACFGHMRRGFRKAQRRFGTGYNGANLFQAILRAVEQCRPEFVGQEFILSYGNGEASCREDHGIWEG